MPKITISYRRADAPSDAGRIFDRLMGRYGKESVFMDIDTIPFGVDFREYIDGALRRTDIVLAVIGPRWLGRRGARSRILEETDPVRIEVEAALRLGKVVVPVLVANATMPGPADLPESLAKLAFLNAAEVDPGKDFHANLDRLIRFIDALPVASDADSPVPEREREPAPPATPPAAQAAPPPIPAAAAPTPAAAAPTPAAAAPTPAAAAPTPAAPPPPSVARPMPSPFVTAPDLSHFAARAAQGRWTGEATPRAQVQPAAPADYARRIQGAWWISIARGVAILADIVARFLIHDGAGSFVHWLYRFLALALLIMMAGVVRGRNAAVGWFLAAAAGYGAFMLVTVAPDSRFTFVIEYVVLALRGGAELAAGLVLLRYVPAERLRIVFAAIFVFTQVVGMLSVIWSWKTPSVFFELMAAASAVVLIVLGRRLRREKLATP